MFTESKKWQAIGYIGFLTLFVVEIAITSCHMPQLEWWQVVLLGVAAFRGGVSLTEDEVFTWLRKPLTITAKDMTGAGDSVSCKYEGGLLASIGGLLSCPICAGTHVGSVLLLVLSLNFNFGILLVYALSVAGMAEVIHAGREFLFWGGRHSREQCK